MWPSNNKRKAEDGYAALLARLGQQKKEVGKTKNKIYYIYFPTRWSNIDQTEPIKQ